MRRVFPPLQSACAGVTDTESAELGPLRLCAVIPVYNHPQTINEVARRVRGYGLPVLLVDDGSEPACADVLDALARRDPEISMLRRAVNGGKGAAVMDGVRWAVDQGYTHVLQIDADGQHDTGAIPGMIAAMRAGPDRLVMGQPRFDASMPAARHYGRWLTHVMVWIESLSLEIRDAMCGFRIYPLAPLLALAARQRLGQRMDFDIEICVRLCWAGVRIDTVEVGVQYPADGISHFRLWDDNRRITLMHLRLLGGMLRRLPRLVLRNLRQRADT